MEFALVSLILFPLLFGILQYGLYFFAAQNGSSALREAARKVSVGDCQTKTVLDDFVKSRMSGVAYSNFDLDRDYAPVATPATAAVGSTVTLSLTFEVLDLNLVPVPGDGTISREVKVRVEDAIEESCA